MERLRCLWETFGVWVGVFQTLQVVLLSDGQGQQADVAEGGRPVVWAQVDQTQLGGTLRVREGQHGQQQEAHRHHKLPRWRQSRWVGCFISNIYSWLLIVVQCLNIRARRETHERTWRVWPLWWPEGLGTGEAPSWARWSLGPAWWTSRSPSPTCHSGSPTVGGCLCSPTACHRYTVHSSSFPWWQQWRGSDTSMFSCCRLKEHGVT